MLNRHYFSILAVLGCLTFTSFSSVDIGLRYGTALAILATVCAVSSRNFSITDFEKSAIFSFVLFALLIPLALEQISLVAGRSKAHPISILIWFVNGSFIFLVSFFLGGRLSQGQNSIFFDKFPKLVFAAIVIVLALLLVTPNEQHAHSYHGGNVKLYSMFGATPQLISAALLFMMFILAIVIERRQNDWFLGLVLMAPGVVGILLLGKRADILIVFFLMLCLFLGKTHRRYEYPIIIGATFLLYMSPRGPFVFDAVVVSFSDRWFESDKLFGLALSQWRAGEFDVGLLGLGLGTLSQGSSLLGVDNGFSVEWQPLKISLEAGYSGALSLFFGWVLLLYFVYRSTDCKRTFLGVIFLLFFHSVNGHQIPSSLVYNLGSGLVLGLLGRPRFSRLNRAEKLK